MSCLAIQIYALSRRGTAAPSRFLRGEINPEAPISGAKASEELAILVSIVFNDAVNIKITEGTMK
jgi:hypothetical protein